MARIGQIPLSRLVLSASLAFLLAPPVAAESLGPGPDAPVATIRILPTSLTPEKMELASGRSLRIENLSTALARVEFRVKRGTGVPCRVSGQPVVSARKFVLSRGEQLECEPPAGRFEYHVQRVVESRNAVSEGAIEVR